ncbi:formin-2-like [Sycon ciliatum]|uniref:formin-2-like n=1 Tax=Sycon ciliatum TaxID=27933 RepID=UPI0031F6477B
MALPVRHGGLAVPILSKTAAGEHQASVSATDPLVQLALSSPSPDCAGASLPPPAGPPLRDLNQPPMVPPPHHCANMSPPLPAGSPLPACADASLPQPPRPPPPDCAGASLPPPVGRPLPGLDQPPVRLPSPDRAAVSLPPPAEPPLPDCARASLPPPGLDQPHVRPPPPDYAGALSPPPAGSPPPDLDQLPDAGSLSALRAEPVAVGLGVEEPGETNPSGPCGVAEAVAAVRAGLRRVRAKRDQISRGVQAEIGPGLSPCQRLLLETADKPPVRLPSPDCAAVSLPPPAEPPLPDCARASLPPPGLDQPHVRPPPPDYAGALSPPPAGPPPPDLDQLPDAVSFSALRAEPVAVGLGVEGPGETNPSGPCGVAEAVAAVRAGLRQVRAQRDQIPPPPDLDQLPDAVSFSALRAEPVAVGLGVEGPGETNPSGPCGVAEAVAAVRAGLRQVRAQRDQISRGVQAEIGPGLSPCQRLLDLFSWLP